MSSSTSISEPKRAAAWLTGAAAAVLALCVAFEALLQLLPAGSDLHRENPRSRASSARLLRNHPYTFSMGWDLRYVVHGRTNSMGFISPHEYRSDAQSIALLGDSFAEGEMLSYEDSLAGHLDALSKGRVQTYNFGLSGASLPHYLGMAREMGPRFPFKAAVVIVGQGDYIEGFESKEGQYRWGGTGEDDIVLVPAETRSLLKQVLRRSALLGYLRGNLKFAAGRMFQHPGEPKCEPVRLRDADLQRLSHYVDALPRALGVEPRRIVLLFNGNTRDVYEHVDRARTGAAPGKTCETLDSLAREQLRSLARARGIHVVEVLPLLESHYRVYRRPLDFRPVDPHWNGLATSIVAAEVARRLASKAPGYF
jgi:hypothetical protein